MEQLFPFYGNFYFPIIIISVETQVELWYYLSMKYKCISSKNILGKSEVYHARSS
jgi:hypothetical protein